MKLVKYATVLALTSTLIACGKDSKKEEGSNGATSSGFQAVCGVLNQSGAPVVCLDIPQTSPALETSCMTTEASNFSAQGAVMGQYLSVSGPGVSTSCALMNNSGLTVVGNCTLSDRVIRYYSGAWTAQTAGADCSARSGQWSP